MILLRSTKPGSVRPSLGQFLVVRAHSAHGDESNLFHTGLQTFSTTIHSVSTPALSRLKTGTAKSSFAFG